MRSYFFTSIAAVGLLVVLASAPAAADTLTSGWIDLGSGTQTPYYIRQGSGTGPLVMVTGGVHGNELAGAAAADQIRTWSITKGTLIVVPFCAPQALAAGTRELPLEGNLNRNFPGVGDPITATTGSTATALWAFIRQYSPQWLIDMHEGIGIASDEASTSVGSSIIHMNESVTNAQVKKMIAAVNAGITDPAKKFTDLGSSGPVDTSLARATVTFLGTRGMIVETTSTGQALALRTNQHRTAVNQFLMDQGMLAGDFGGPRFGVIDEFTFDEPTGSKLADAGNSFPNGGSWDVTPFSTRTLDGVLRVQRSTTGTSTTSTGALGAGEVRVRRVGETGNTATDIGEGFATMVVDGWDFRSTQIGETIAFGFRNSVSGTVEDTAHLLVRRTGLDEVSLLGAGFGTGSGTIAPDVRFRAVQETPVQFVLQLNKETNLNGTPLVSGSAAGGFYRIYSQTLGQGFVQVGSGAAVRQDRNGNHLTMKISGSIGAGGGFFDIDRMAFSSVFPQSLVSSSGVVSVLAGSGTVTQAAAGYPWLSGTVRVEKAGAGTLVLDAANTLSGSLTVNGGRLHVAHPLAIPTARLAPLFGSTVTIAPGLQTTIGSLSPSAGGQVDVGSGMVTVAEGLSATSLLNAIRAGRGTGAWNGQFGITSSAAAASDGLRTVGWIDNGDGSLTFGYAAAGDANLDWEVDILDMAAFTSSGNYGTGRAATWSQGDFNYDGVFDVLDMSEFVSAGLFQAGSYNGPAATLAAVPEPRTSWLGVIGLAAAIAVRQGTRRELRRTGRDQLPGR